MSASFNRLVTQRVGALEDNFLARNRPLGQARVLWEIGPEGCDVVRLRSLLELDSGYLSRLLRSLEADGLVVVKPHAGDRRVRVARLTPQGIRERELLDEAADGLARSLLEPLSEAGRARLVESMAEVERLLTASLVEISPADPSHRDVQLCIGRYFAEIDERFENGFDMSLSVSTTLDDFRPPAGVFLVARLRGEAVGCGGLRFRGEDPPELKRMWVRGERAWARDRTAAAGRARGGRGCGRRPFGSARDEQGAHGGPEPVPLGGLPRRGAFQRRAPRASLAREAASGPNVRTC